MQQNTQAESLGVPARHARSARLLRSRGAVIWRAKCDVTALASGVRISESKLTLPPSAKCSRYFLVKPWLEWTMVALLLLLPAVLIIGTLGFLVLLTSGWPIFYCQARVGKCRRLFTVWKLRTMCVNAEDSSGPVWCGRSDSRVTWIGHFLRMTHLDELPQLWNVLAGDMSLIGPRPERPEIVGDLAREIPNYLNRLAVLPGITGWAQIHQDSDVDLADVRSKQDFDLEYIRHANLLMDLRILIETLPRLLGMSPRTKHRQASQHLRITPRKG